jgi:thiamine pyrophosphokinase
MIFFMQRAVIFINGVLPDPALVCALLKPDDYIIAVDGGTHHILELGLSPSIIIGDLDSLSDGEKKIVEERKIRTLIFSADKDETDLELALNYAVESGYQDVLLVGALGRRLDQTLGNLSLLTNPSLSKMNLRMDDGLEEVIYINKKGTIQGMAGDLVSLVPWGGDVTGITTMGLRWALKRETLFSHKTRGISNQLLSEDASVTIKSGHLLVIHRRKDYSTK